MFKQFRGTLPTTVLVWPIKLSTAVRRRTSKILALLKSWKRSTSNSASDLGFLPHPSVCQKSRECRSIALNPTDLCTWLLCISSQSWKCSPLLRTHQSWMIHAVLKSTKPTVLKMGIGHVLVLSTGRSFTSRPCNTAVLQRCLERGWRGNRIRDSPLP